MRWGMAIILWSMLLWLGACGSKSSTESDRVILPLASATADPVMVESGGKVTLRGQGSSYPPGGTLVFHWQVVGNPSPVSFSANDSANASEVWVVLQEIGTYLFTLTVENEHGWQSHPDTVEVLVKWPFNGTARIHGNGPGTGDAQIGFVWIEPGTFTMGSPPSEVGRELDEDQYQVTVSKGFYLGKYELTQGQWQALTGGNPSYFKGSPNLPVEKISWDDVQTFIQNLNNAEGGEIYRLPTEAEWEYACRAGTMTTWSFGDDKSQLRQYAWYGGNNDPDGTKIVGTKLPNPWGLYDMHGNVEEWCQDLYGLYPNSAQTDPMPNGTRTVFPPAVFDGRDEPPKYPTVVRGGAYYFAGQYTRSAFRDYNNDHSPTTGARLLRIKVPGGH